MIIIIEPFVMIEIEVNFYDEAKNEKFKTPRSKV